MQQAVLRGKTKAAQLHGIADLPDILGEGGNEADHHGCGQIDAERQTQALQGLEQVLHTGGKGQGQHHIDHHGQTQEGNQHGSEIHSGQGGHERMQALCAGKGQGRHEQERKVGDQQHADVAHGQGVEQRHGVEHKLGFRRGKRNGRH